MPQENVEVVRSLQAPWEGKDVIDVIRTVLERIGPVPQREAVLAAWAQDPGWRHVHPEIERDTSATGAMGGVARGPTEVRRGGPTGSRYGTATPTELSNTATSVTGF